MNGVLKHGSTVKAGPKSLIRKYSLKLRFWVTNLKVHKKSNLIMNLKQENGKRKQRDLW